MRHPYITDIRREAIEEGITQGAEQTRIETAKKMLENCISTEIIANCTGLSLEQVKQLAKELKG